MISSFVTLLGLASLCSAVKFASLDGFAVPIQECGAESHAQVQRRQVSSTGSIALPSIIGSASPTPSLSAFAPESSGCGAAIYIRFYNYYISGSQTRDAGFLSQTNELGPAVARLNENFAPHFTFTQLDTDYRPISGSDFQNMDIESDNDDLLLAIGETLLGRTPGNEQIGSAKILNVVIAPNSTSCGFSPVAIYDEYDSRYLTSDFVVVANDCMDNSPAAGDQILTTLTHETAHWLGAYHIFQGGCTGGNGDYVSDTPVADYLSSWSQDYNLYQSYLNCSAAVKGTCSSNTAAEALSNAHNYMSYSWGPCRNEFTAGQIERMTAIAGAFRGLQSTCDGSFSAPLSASDESTEVATSSSNVFTIQTETSLSTTRFLTTTTTAPGAPTSRPLSTSSASRISTTISSLGSSRISASSQPGAAASITMSKTWAAIMPLLFVVVFQWWI